MWNDDDYYNSIAAGSSYAAPSEDDFNLIFAKPKKPKAESANVEEKAQDNVETAETNDDASAKIESRQSELGFSSGLDAKEKVSHTDGFNKAILLMVLKRMMLLKNQLIRLEGDYLLEMK